MLLFFAALFTFVLIHPDVDLLDVHDVKITNARSQIHTVEQRLIPQVPASFARPQPEQASLLDRSVCKEIAGGSGVHPSASILRV